MSGAEDLFSQFDPDTGMITGGKITSRRLSEIRGSFAQPAMVERLLAQGDPVVYTVASREPATGEGQLHFGVGRIMPGKVGDEYFLTKGHLHSWRQAAEVYIGVRGRGKMLLQDEESGRSTVLDLLPHATVYVPGATAHRTINVGQEPLVYLGIYPADAGHDYGSIGQTNFSSVVIEQGGEPLVMDRTAYLNRIQRP